MAQLRTTAPSHHENASASSSSMASCSASTSYSLYDFDVFINHRGPDVKNTFASYLYFRLRSHGIRVFLDKPELEAGQPITPQILHAIESASIHIAIFSSAYAESRWCLDELLCMLKAFKSNKGTIIPVFYGVKPSDLRWTAKGAYAEAFHKHEMKQRYDTQIIQSWKDALSEVAEISGLELDAFNGDQGQLLEVAVQRILKMIDKTPLKYVAEHPTGLKEKLEEFDKSVLSQQHSMNVKVVGIAGLGGVGKTTLAKEFFNTKRSDYSQASFLSDVRENAAKGSLISFQQCLIKDLTRRDVQINTINEGIDNLRKHLLSCHALIVLDDVDHIGQLEAFLPIKGILSSNSLILVTSRDKQVLQTGGISRFEHLTSLEWLEVQDCNKLQSISGLGQLTKLRLLALCHCGALQELPGVASMRSPLALMVFDCPQLPWGRPDFEQLRQRLKGSLLVINEKHQRVRLV